STFNYGNQTENYWVKMRITPSYDESAQVTGHLPGTARYFTFPNWTAVVRGNYTTRCSTVNVQDNNASNDHKTATGFVRVRDCGVLSLSAPSGLYQRGEVVAPAATWHNWGNVSAGFEAWMKLHDPTDAEVYAEKVDIASLLPGANIFVTAFPNCTLLTGGRWYVRCSTYYAGDQVVLNDVLVDSFEVSIGNPDIGVMSIVAPAGNVDTGEVVTPQGRVKNYGDVAVLFRAWFVMNDPTDAEVYREYVDVSGLGIGAETTLVFPDYNVGTTEGGWTTRCSVATPGDVEPDNDFRSGSFTVSSRPPWPAGWDEVTSMPAGAKAVKDGGWLAIGEEGGLVYGARGNKVGDFYSYDAMDSAWAALTAIPNGSEGKSPYKGAAGCVAGNHIYATKGNSTLGFWRYSIDSLTWTQMPDVPLGPSGKKVKGGTDMVYVTEGDTGFAYLLKGYKQDFFRFNTVSGVWDTSLPPAPAGARPKWDKGSWCGLSPQPDPPGIIFCHKAKYHELWAYDVATRTWGTTALPGMPLVGMMGKSKKSKDGGCAAFFAGSLYALKGGNTQEFWRFDLAHNDWSEKDTMPSVGSTAKKKRVKAGGDIVHWGDGVFYALKGNKTNELWRYVEGVAAQTPRPERAGVAGRPTVLAGHGVAVVPNPAGAGVAALRYSLPLAGPARLRLFDVTGRTVLEQGLTAGRTGTVGLDLSGLSAGVYLVKFASPGYESVQKLVIR
ncbi:T9SS type A sorting domain-containing protein, partial [candidate division WOR-3 bacterium]|nr:T9SS type A sorting domain-containing protein [candidate division WOR-3 bacterium]